MLTPLTTESKEALWDDHGVLPARLIAWMCVAPPGSGRVLTPRNTCRWRMYMGARGVPACLADFRCSPLAVASVRGLPRSVVFLATYDTLRSEGLEFAARLEAAGVPVQLNECVGSHVAVFFGDCLERMGSAAAAMLL